MKLFSYKFNLLAGIIILTNFQQAIPQRNIRKSAPDLQSIKIISALKVGDKVPDIAFNNLVNYNKHQLKLSDFKNKVVILDFWATWCSSCLSEMPHEYALQQKLSAMMAVVLVDEKSTKDDHQKVARFFERRKGTYEFTSIVGDTILNKFFPHFTIPHFVWIRNNIVVAIPEASDLTEDHIKAVYHLQPVRLSEDNYVPFDYTKEIFPKENESISSKHLYHSVLNKYQPGLLSTIGFTVDDLSRVSRIDAINQSLLSMICFAITDFTGLQDDRILRNLKHPIDLGPDSTSAQWKNKNCFVYEATFPPRDKNAALSFMKADIQRYFGIRYYGIEKDTDCFVLSTTDISKVTKGKAGVHSESNFEDHLDKPIYFENTTANAIVSLLEDFYRIPVIDDSKYKGKISLSLPQDLNDLPTMASTLQKQGFRISREKRKVWFLVIEDLN